jgi:hypothetical protein
VDKPRIVGRQNKRGDQARDCRIAGVEDLIDDSVEFIGEELSRLQLSPKKVEEGTERMKYGLFSEWTVLVLNLQNDLCDLLGQPMLSEEEIAEFIRGKFGIEVEPPPPHDDPFGIDPFGIESD